MLSLTRCGVLVTVCLLIPLTAVAGEAGGMTPQEIALSQAEHASIAKAILGGRPEQAETAMRRHIRRAKLRTSPGLSALRAPPRTRASLWRRPRAAR